MEQASDQREGGARRRVLMLTHRLPYPPDRGDRIRSYHLLRTLSEHFEVAVACTTDEPVWLQHHQLLSTMATRVAIQPITARWSQLKGLRALLIGRAITPAYYHRDSLAEQIRQWHQQAPFDAILTFCSGMLEYARALTTSRSLRNAARPNGPYHVLDLVDVDSIKWQSYAAESPVPLRWIYGAEARRLRRIEAGRHDHFDAVTVTTPAEAQAYQKHVGQHANLTIVANGVDLEYFHPQPDNDSKSIVFVGVLNYRPNVDGIVWFVEQVMPRLLESEPNAKVSIVGRHPTPRVLQLAGRAGTQVVGSVPDVREYLRKASVVVAPLLMARGIQNKVLEAMASARAVVCSPSAAQGVDAEDEVHLLVADEPQQWVDQLARIMNDADLRNRIAAAARQRVEQRYDWKRAIQPMVDLIGGERRQVAVDPSPGSMAS